MRNRFGIAFERLTEELFIGLNNASHGNLTIRHECGQETMTPAKHRVGGHALKMGLCQSFNRNMGGHEIHKTPPFITMTQTVNRGDLLRYAEPSCAIISMSYSSSVPRDEIVASMAMEPCG